MNNIDYINIMLKIYENYNKGNINDNEKTFLMYEMKSRREYIERNFLNSFIFVPLSREQLSGAVDEWVYGIIVFDGFVTIGVIAPDKKIAINGAYLDNNTRCDPDTGIITINKDILMKLKSREYRNSIIYHEFGHYKLHSAVVEDPSLSEPVLLEIICDIIEQTPIHDKDFIGFVNSKMKLFRDLYKIYAHKLNHVSQDEHDQILINYRHDCINIFNKYCLGRHTTSVEFEADKFAANRIGVIETCKALKNILNVSIKRNKNEYQKLIHRLDSEYGMRKNEIKRLNKSLKGRPNIIDYEQELNKLNKQYDEMYNLYTRKYNRVNDNLRKDVRQRIKVLTDVSILMDRRFNEIY